MLLEETELFLSKTLTDFLIIKVDGLNAQLTIQVIFHSQGQSLQKPWVCLKVGPCITNSNSNI